MSHTFEDLSYFSRKELYSMINALKREINCLSTDLLRFQLLSKKCENYSKVLQTTNKIDEKLTQDIVDLVAINGIQCYLDCGPRVETIADSDSESDATIHEDTNEYHSKSTSKDNTRDSHQTSAKGVHQSVGKPLEVIHESKDQTIDTRVVNKLSDVLSETQILRQIDNQLNATNANTNGTSTPAVQYVLLCPAPTATYPCPTVGCFAVFPTSESLNQHMITVGHISPSDKTPTNTSTTVPVVPAGGQVADNRTAFIRIPQTRQTRQSTDRQSINTGHDSVANKISGKTTIITPVLADGGQGSDSRTAAKPMPQTSQSTGKQLLMKCSKCQKTFKTTQDLAQHELRVHPEDLPDIPWIKCAENGCQYKTKSKSYLRQHVTTKHSDRTDPDYTPTDRPYKCKVTHCRESFDLLNDLTRHQLARHPDSLPHITWTKCSVNGCFFKTKSKDLMTEHRRNHKVLTYAKANITGVTTRPTIIIPAVPKPTATTRPNIIRPTVAKTTITRTVAKVYMCPEPGCGIAYTNDQYICKHSTAVRAQAAQHNRAINIRAPAAHSDTDSEDITIVNEVHANPIDDNVIEL